MALRGLSMSVRNAYRMTAKDRTKARTIGVGQGDPRVYSRQRVKPVVGQGLIRPDRFLRFSLSRILNRV